MRVAASVLTVAILAGTCGPGFAQTADWRFCVASDFNRHVAYLTPPFESEAKGRDLENRLAAELTEKNLPFQNVQCRLPTDIIQSEAQRGDAAAFVKALGFQLEDLN